MERAVRGRGGRGCGAGRNPGRRMNTRANAGEQASSAGSDAANTAGESTRSPATQVSESVSHTQNSVQQEDIHVDPLTVMQGMMAQMMQMANLMETMHHSVTQNQQAPPPLRKERGVSTIINDISRQRPPTFEGSSKPADIIHSRFVYRRVLSVGAGGGRRVRIYAENEFDLAGELGSGR
ncbi:hypothetical protein OROMI_003785 [Orobanche minor]